ncbi:hypothetical protein [Histidinibacterium lentulum]|uniref:Uncharacterized protein n=1 Tax=Histidinibacterium lentulum TaxID=2480588 RepID=A0A3N2R4H5_9RHOB|nr:hypothetical protein [Histidinibacterium lentulum]ROU02395.1 hypothetical protein EAT49_08610 [Histidinibacterium lentulum]
MSDRVVELGERRARGPGHDFWFAQVDLRLTRIETMVARLEKTLWLAGYGAGTLLALVALAALIGWGSGGR